MIFVQRGHLLLLRWFLWVWLPFDSYMLYTGRSIGSVYMACVYLQSAWNVAALGPLRFGNLRFVGRYHFTCESHWQLDHMFLMVVQDFQTNYSFPLYECVLFLHGSKQEPSFLSMQVQPVTKITFRSDSYGNYHGFIFTTILSWEEGHIHTIWSALIMLLPCRHVRWVCRTCCRSLFVLAIACYVFMHSLFWKRSSFFPCRTSSWTLCTCQCDDALQKGHQPWPPFVSYTLPWIELEDLLLLTTVVAKKLAFKFLVCSMGLSLPSVFHLFSLLPNLGMLSMSWIASYKSMRATLNHRSLVFNFFSQIIVSHVSFHLKKHNFLSDLQCTRISILLIIAHTSPC